MLLEKKVSIVIPVYNAAKYLEPCLESVLNQSYRNVEIVVVDDGSSDNSRLICEKFEKKDSRVRYYFQDNQGVSVARNQGIKKASGDYVLFVDADDGLDPNAVELCIKSIEDEKASLVCFNFKFLKTGAFFLNDDFVFSEESLLNKEKLLNNLFIPNMERDLNLGFFFRASWGKMFDLSIIKNNGIRFPEYMKFSEDAMFVFDYLMHSSSVKILKNHLYHYRVHESSAVQSYKKDFFYDVLREFQEIRNRESLFNLDWNRIYLNFWLERSIALWRNIEKKKDVSYMKRCFLLYSLLKKVPYQGHFCMPNKMYKLLWYIPFALKLSLFQTMAVIFTTRYRKG